MVPATHLEVYVKRLIAHGYKVGVCRQTETRALKAVTENANKPFERKLSGVYTASTWIDHVSCCEKSDEQVICAIVDRPTSRTCTALAFVSIDMATSSITYDEWLDDSTREGLYTRIMHLVPREVVLLSSLSDGTRRAVSMYATASATYNVRMETREAFESLASFLQGDVLAWALAACPVEVQRALALLLTHLATYDLTSAFHYVDHYATFTSRSSMVLSGSTLSHLELLRNATDHGEDGSLFWLLDECATSMGRRLLRQWIRRPLVDPVAIQARADAVSLLRERRDRILHRVVSLLTHLPDLTRGLTRILYTLVDPAELVSILLTLYRVTHEIEAHDSTRSTLLNTALQDLRAPKSEVSAFVSALHIPNARSNSKVSLYTDSSRYPAIQKWKQQLEDDELAAQLQLVDIRRILRRPALQFISIAGIDHLIEVRASDAGRVPADWVRINSTKRAVRFHTPAIVELQRQRDRHREMLTAVANEAFRDFVRHVAQVYMPLRRAVHALATIDVLTSLARVASRPGYVRPHVHDQGNSIQLRQCRHPVTEARTNGYIPNDIALGSLKQTEAPRGMLLTGSNMGGKSSMMRAIALTVIMAQIGSFVPCQSAEITCRDAIASRMGARDDILRGESTFLVEARETAFILRTSTPRTLVLLDEFGRGTSTFDGMALAYAVLRSFLERGPAMPTLLFITHYAPLTRLAHLFPQQLMNVHMQVQIMRHQGKQDEVVFLHRVLPGAASRSFGIHAAALSGIPTTIIERAKIKALELEEAERLVHYAHVVKLLGQGDAEAALESIQSITLEA